MLGQSEPTILVNPHLPSKNLPGHYYGNHWRRIVRRAGQRRPAEGRSCAVRALRYTGARSIRGKSAGRADPDGFIQRRDDGVAFAAHVCRVDAAGFGGRRGQRDQLFGSWRTEPARIAARSTRPPRHRASHRVPVPACAPTLPRSARGRHRPAPCGALRRAYVARQVDSHALLLRPRGAYSGGDLTSEGSG